MKKLLLLAFAAFFFAASNAQVKREVAPSQKIQSDSTHHFRKKKEMNQLNLTSAQKTQMKELNESSRQQREEIKNDQSLTDTQKREKMKELHKTHSGKINAILTPDQQVKWKAMMKERRQNKKPPHKMQPNSAS